MSTNFKWVLMVAALATLAGCSSAPKDTRVADEAAIRANSIAWSNAAHAQDMEKVLAMYSDDAVAFDDGGPVETTAAQRRANWTADLNGSISWKTTKVEVAKSGDIAYEYGAYQYISTAKDGTQTTTPGKYVLVWKKQVDGTWKVAIDIDNKDVGPPAPPPPAPAHAKSAHHKKSKGRASRHR
jgi:ketosteroid isomerase-like protein